MKQQFVVIHITRQFEIPASQDIWITETPSAKMLYPQKFAFTYTFLNTQHA